MVCNFDNLVFSNFENRRGRSVKFFLFFNGILAIVVWGGFRLFIGSSFWATFSQHWQVSLTMVFGSLIGGGTSEGGGAVAFPVLTKVLKIDAEAARLFTFAVQSVGMGCASASILMNKVPIEWRTIRSGLPFAFLGVLISSAYFSKWLSGPIVRQTFTAIVSCLALALVISRFKKTRRRKSLPNGVFPVALIALAGFAGGVLSGIAGVGENTIIFILLVLVFNVSEEIATPTTVIMMAAVSQCAFAYYLLFTDDFNGEAFKMWVAAAPICAVGAPLGALLLTFMSRNLISGILIALILIEFVTTLLIVPFSSKQLAVFFSVIFVGSCLILWAEKRLGQAKFKDVEGNRA